MSLGHAQENQIAPKAEHLEIRPVHFGLGTEIGATGSECARDERSQAAQPGALTTDQTGPKEEQSWDGENRVWLRALLTLRGR
jgi:hypothetical protein